jgi:serine/threonine protein kinase
MKMDTNGSAIGKRYLLHESLGRGGMGVVYRATDRLTGREVALKQVNTDTEVLGLDNSYEEVDFRLAMAREFKLSSSLRHPNIIKVLDYGFANSRSTNASNSSCRCSTRLRICTGAAFCIAI